MKIVMLIVTLILLIFSACAAGQRPTVQQAIVIGGNCAPVVAKLVTCYLRHEDGCLQNGLVELVACLTTAPTVVETAK